MAQNITLLGASYSAVPGVTLPKTGGGTATFYDVSDTTAAAYDVATGKYFYTAAGVLTQGTNSGGGGGSVQMDSVGAEGSATSTLSISGLYGEPTSFALFLDNGGLTPSSTPQVDSLVYDGTNLHGQTITNTTNAQVSYDSAFSKSYSNGTLTITSTNAIFVNDEYILNYSYGGSSACINTADVQVGSGATSITFTDLEDEPIYWSCIFKSNFSTSSGYQRVIFVNGWAGSVYGHCMDSTTKDSGSWWTPSYNNGSLTITSQGTNAGGYFHQPGYYQLTYVVADASPYEKKSETYRASTSAQTDKIEPSSGYDAMSEVNITIPAVTQTNLTADNIKSGTTISISNGQSNLWSVTGTYGGGGSSKNAQVVQGTTRTTSSSLTAIGAEMTVSKTGTYDVYWSAFRSNTSSQYTFATKLYINGTGYGSEQTTWSNHQQNVHLSNVSLTKNDKIRVYGRESRGSSYYMYAGTLTIIEA